MILASKRPRRRATIILGSLIGLGSLVLVIVPNAAAGAAEVEASCIGTQHSRFSPGLRFQPRDVTVTVSTIYGPCTSPSVPALISGTQSSSFIVTNASCLNPFDPGSGTKIIKWNTGQTSTFSFSRVGSNVGGSTVVTETGGISAGLFAGDTAVEQVTGPTPETLKCFSQQGVTDRFNVLQLAIARP